MAREDPSPDWLDQQVPWRSVQPATPTPTHGLVVGDIVAYDQRPCTILAVDADGVPFKHWPDSFHTRWKMVGESIGLAPERWNDRPWYVALEVIGTPLPSTSSQDNGRFCNVAVTKSYLWSVLPEHYMVCRICNEIPPCRHARQEKLLHWQQRELLDVLNLDPSTCLGCAEPITSRQKIIRFAGPNLVRPDFGDDSAVFHHRRACRKDVEDYDRRLTMATGAVPRFNCNGELTVHHNDDVECSRSDQCIGFDHAHAVYKPHRPTLGPTNFDDCWCMQPSHMRNDHEDT